MQLDVLRIQWRHSVRFLRTVRYLKLRQVTNRLYRRIKKPALLILSDRDGTFNSVTGWSEAVSQPKSILSPESVMFLNEIGLLGSWNDSSKSDLWLYNLHYFNYLHETLEVDSPNLKKSLIASWIEQNQPLCSPAWDPYPTSLRIVNWVKWFLNGNEPFPDFLASLYQQSHVLYQNIEYHLMGNHLIANAKALIFAGHFFDGNRAELWRNRGFEILDEQLCEQILPDGAHFELSPMYHSIVLLDVLDLIQLAIFFPSEGMCNRQLVLRSLAERMIVWLIGMVHPDQGICFFNDASFGVAPSLSELLQYAKILGLCDKVPRRTDKYFESSGYASINRFDQYAVMDLAKIGPDYIPGHAHADNLSFEWSIFGTRVLVNSGISEYTAGEIRDHERGTSAHNTVVVNGRNSSEVWSAFRVASRANTFGVSVNILDDEVHVEAAHDGYQCLESSVIHRRQWTFKEGIMEVRDVVQGKHESAQAYFYFHPDIAIDRKPQGLVVTLPSGDSVFIEIDGGRFDLQLSSWCPEFGKRVENMCLIVDITGPTLITRFNWESNGSSKSL